jgi:hypothetical protein
LTIVPLHSTTELQALWQWLLLSALRRIVPGERVRLPKDGVHENSPHLDSRLPVPVDDGGVFHFQDREGGCLSEIEQRVEVKVEGECPIAPLEEVFAVADGVAIHRHIMNPIVAEEDHRSDWYGVVEMPQGSQVIGGMDGRQGKDQQDSIDLALTESSHRTRKSHIPLLDKDSRTVKPPISSKNIQSCGAVISGNEIQIRERVQQRIDATTISTPNFHQQATFIQPRMEFLRKIFTALEELSVVVDSVEVLPILKEISVTLLSIAGFPNLWEGVARDAFLRPFLVAEIAVEVPRVHFLLPTAVKIGLVLFRGGGRDESPVSSATAGKSRLWLLPPSTSTSFTSTSTASTLIFFVSPLQSSCSSPSPLPNSISQSPPFVLSAAIHYISVRSI